MTQGVDDWKLIQNVLVMNNISVYVFLEITTKSVYVFLGIFMTYPFLALERGGGCPGWLIKKNLPWVISEIQGLPWPK